MNEKINVRLQFSFKQLTDETDAYNDCILKMGSGKEFPFVRILLSKNSKKFEKYFEDNDNKASGTPTIFQIDKDIEDESMEEFLNFLYTNYLKLTVENIPRLLKITTRYEFTVISELLRKFVSDAINDDTLLHFVHEFIENKLDSDAKALAPLIAQHLYRIENNDPDEKITSEQIYKAVTPSIFSIILIEKNKLGYQTHQNNDGTKLRLYLYNPGPLSNDVKNIIHIENYVKYLGSISDDDKKELSKVINWDDPIAMSYLIDYPCDWVPAEFSNPLIFKILKKRNILLNKFKKGLQAQPDEISRWYGISWLKTIRNVEQPYDDLPIIEFIRTIGGMSKPVDPVKYGLIGTKSSQPLITINQPRDAFIRDPKLYFMSKSIKKQMPYLSFSLGPNTLFSTKNFFLDSRFKLRNQDLYAENKGLVQSVNIKAGNDKNSKSVDIPVDDPQNLVGSKIILPPSSEFTITLNGETSKHSDLFRVAQIDIIGNFQLEH